MTRGTAPRLRGAAWVWSEQQCVVTNERLTGVMLDYEVDVLRAVPDEKIEHPDCPALGCARQLSCTPSGDRGGPSQPERGQRSSVHPDIASGDIGRVIRAKEGSDRCDLVRSAETPQWCSSEE